MIGVVAGVAGVAGRDQVVFGAVAGLRLAVAALTLGAHLFHVLFVIEAEGLLLRGEHHRAGTDVGRGRPGGSQFWGTAASSGMGCRPCSAMVVTAFAGLKKAARAATEQAKTRMRAFICSP